MARKEGFVTRYSGLNHAIAQALVRTGYLKSVAVKSGSSKSFLEVKIAYKAGRPAMHDFRILSKPGRRLYSGVSQLSSVRQGYGIGVLTTPSGVMTTDEARKEKVGGEYLFQIW